VFVIEIRKAKGKALDVQAHASLNATMCPRVTTLKALAGGLEMCLADYEAEIDRMTQADDSEAGVVVRPYPICEQKGCTAEAITSRGSTMLCGLHAFPSVCDHDGCTAAAVEAFGMVLLCAEHAAARKVVMQNDDGFTRCAVDGCGQSCSEPPKLDAQRRPICTPHALLQYGHECTYCKAALSSVYHTYALDAHGSNALQLELAGKPLCITCWESVGYAYPGYTPDDQSERNGNAAKVDA
jgi:hypothetical protein